MGFIFCLLAIELRVRPVNWDVDLNLNLRPVDLDSDLRPMDLDLGPLDLGWT